ncbi:MAG TPA: bifunctional nicotinamidase/pyrazinamidase [Halanaerobiales bacterium]|nr:bifunctional nicotinamidase/pyrazinamidase [Halanaerobiales bacterium]
MNKALLVVDVQNDFYPGGALAVPKANEINSKINSLMESGRYKTIVGTQDWHPKNHRSFASNHNMKPFTEFKAEGLGPVLWPDHCVQGTEGAEFHSDINTDRYNLILRKGYNYKIDSYSAFQENDGTELGLDSYLKGLGIEEVYIVGLALDVCVKFTAQDAVKNGFDTTIILSGSQAIEEEPDKLQEIIDEMKEKGIKFQE